jgi:hypothetical protein
MRGEWKFLLQVERGSGVQFQSTESIKYEEAEEGRGCGLIVTLVVS